MRRPSESERFRFHPLLALGARIDGMECHRLSVRQSGGSQMRVGFCAVDGRAGDNLGHIQVMVADGDSLRHAAAKVGDAALDSFTSFEDKHRTVFGRFGLKPVEGVFLCSVAACPRRGKIRAPGASPCCSTQIADHCGNAAPQCWEGGLVCPIPSLATLFSVFSRPVALLV